MRVRNSIPGYILSIFVLAITVSTYAEEPDSIYKKIPEMNRHTFIPMNNFDSPFIHSFIKMGMGIAQTEAMHIGSLEINGNEIYTIEGSVLFSNGDIMYQQKVKDWLAVYINFNASARFGTQLSSLYTEGLNTVTGYDLGWVVKVSEGEEYFLSAHIQLSDYRANFLHVNRIFKNISEDSILNVSESIPALYGTLGIRLAWAPGDLLGFGFNGNLGYGESFNRTDSHLYTRLAAVAEMDLLARTRIPLGISIKSIFSSVPSYLQLEDSYINITGLKLAYTGGHDYIFGIESSWGVLPLNYNDEKVNSLMLSLQFHMYF